MTDLPPRQHLIPIPRSGFLIWMNLALALIVAAIGFGLGFGQGVKAQTVILSTVISVAVLLWLLNYIAVMFETRAVVRDPAPKTAGVWRSNRVLIIAMVLLLLVYLIVTATVPEFRSITNLIAFLVLEAILLFAFKVSGQFATGRSAFIGLIVLVALIVISSFTIEGFLSGPNIKAILLFAAFLGIACIGQTLVALMGGLDLSIPFVIGASNIGLLFLISLGVPSFVAAGFVLIIGGVIGFINGVLSYKLQGQALIMTLGMGFAVAGLTQILTSIGSAFGGNVFGTVPPWLQNLAAMNGQTFGLGFPPTILIWIVLAIIVIVALRYSAYGRYIYALGGNRRSAKLIGVSRVQILDPRLHPVGRVCRPDRIAAAGVVGRRVHRGGRSLSVHHAGGSGHWRHLADWRQRWLRVHRDRGAGASGAVIIPDRDRPEIRMATIHLRSADLADGRAVWPIAAYQSASLGRAHDVRSFVYLARCGQQRLCGGLAGDVLYRDPVLSGPDMVG